MHRCNINKSRRGGIFFGSPGRQTFPDEYYPLISEVTDEILDFAQQNVVRFRSYLVTDDVNDVIGKF